MNNWVLEFLKNETEHFSFGKYVLFTLDEGMYC